MDSRPGHKKINLRKYGTAGPLVVLLHGGPGAAGYMASIAKEISDSFRVLEPFQRNSSARLLTVARHIADLHQLLTARSVGILPALVGHSWGAMLALAYAAEHPNNISSLILVGCATFDSASRARMDDIRAQRMTNDLNKQFEQLQKDFPDPNDRFAEIGRLMQQIDSYDLISTGEKNEYCDALANQQTWDDMMWLQQQGVYPFAFRKIRVPVLMLHGDHDPHPGQMIFDSLKPYIRQLRYREFQNCGHYPWLEKAAEKDFYSALRSFLTNPV